MSEITMSEIDRRTFVQGAAMLSGLAMARSAGAAVVGSNERVRLGVIGVGNRGDQLIDAFLPHKDAQIVAVCDVYQPYVDAARSKVGGTVDGYRDYRKLLERNDIDAVIVATPDHWHALQCIEACRAGKDVYVEKPLSLTVAEGRRMCEVAQETGRVTQVGLHRRSIPYLQEAVQRVRDGEIGRVSVVRCYTTRNETPMGIGNPPDGEPPAELDWDLWLGPAPKVPYNPNRCLYKFRWFWNYSGGQMTNMATHYIDVIQWALHRQAPELVFAAGGKFVVKDNREIPDTMEAVWQYDGPTLVTYSQWNGNGSPATEHGYEIELMGTHGTLGIGSQGYEIFPERVRREELPTLSPLDRRGNSRQGSAVRVVGEPEKVDGRSNTTFHARNFLDCVKSRQPTNCPIEVGHRSTTTTLLANISLRANRSIRWDADRERIVGDDEANQWLSYEYRQPWRLE